ncbi:MAG: glycoside hydrolase family 3 N-terminal domain-containing protein [Gemmatimonadales bacterium]
MRSVVNVSRSDLAQSLLLLCALAAAGCAATQSSSSASATATVQSGDQQERHFVDSVLAGMTLEEKVGQLNQISGLGQPTGPGGVPSGIEQIKRGEIGSFLNVIGRDTVVRLQRIAVEQSRTHIPLLFALDVIHGFRTTFPVPLAEASSWNPSGAERSARIAAAEASAEGIHWTFAPMVDVARDPRWGRIVEGAGEDTYLGAVIAAARVRGFQGSNLRDPSSIIATAKHFAAYGAAEGGRDYNIADVPERTLRDVYLPPFQAAACAGVATFMAAFNEIDGVPAHANGHLLNDILRGEWKYDGLVVSDWGGIGEMLNHGVGPDAGSVGRLAMNAGVDIDMMSEIYRKEGPSLVRAQSIAPAVLDEAVRRMLRLKYRLGLFQNPYRVGDAKDVQGATLSTEHRTAAREVARESIVLLKNDHNALPLSKSLGTLAVIGSLAADSDATIGNWGAQGRGVDAVSVLTGIKRAVSSSTRVLYSRGTAPLSNDTTGIADAVRTARQADAVVLVIGESPDQSAEAESRAIIELPASQQRLAEAIVATGKPVVVVLMNGRPLALQWLHDKVPAIVETWFLGVEHGAATADVLFGDYNPGGKLTTTFPRVTGQVPIYYNHRNTGRPPTNEKYTSKYNDVPWTPLYPFGHGLSYTTFTYGIPRLSAATMRPGDSIRVEVSVTNSGKVGGDEVVQLYIRDDVGSVTRPVKELRGFQRVHLNPGETKTIPFSIHVEDLAFHNAALERVAEPGTFTVYVGGSSDGLKGLPFRLDTNGGPIRVPATCQDLL